MEFEFDKEMDSLLRQAARSGETAFAGESDSKLQIPDSKSFHLDADEISLFAENVLPDKARIRVTEHLADCDRCRKILSNVISLNDETESENVHAKEIAAVAAPVPWYKNLFAFPQIAYAMGALALVFSGIIGVFVLRNFNETQNTSVAQIEKTSGAPNETDSSRSEVYPSPNAPSANMAMNTNSSLAATTNTSAAANLSNRQTATQNAPSANAGASSSSESKSAGVVKDSKAQSAPENQMTIDGVEADEAEKSRSVVAGNQSAPKREEAAQAENNETVTIAKPQAKKSAPSAAGAQSPAASVSARSVSELPINGRRANNLSLSADGATAAQSRKKDKETSAETSRTVGGKTFKRADGVWYDSAYNQQKTTNVRRGSDDYKKLDSGLRSIAENLGGTIVVVWKAKAYRIQ